MPSLRPRAVTQYTSAFSVDTHLGPDDSQAGGDSYLKKILAYIPIESVGLYQVTVNTFAPSDPLFVDIVGIIWVITPFWMLYSTHAKGQTLSWDQAVTSVPAFIFWLAGLQSPFVIQFLATRQIVWKDSYGTFALVVGSMLLPVLGNIVLWLADRIRAVVKSRIGEP
jgi:hypothetical protein